MTKRVTTLDQLPIPQSRSELFLDYIARNSGVGGGGGDTNASQVTFDNAESGLDSTNVQDAINEVNKNTNEKIEKRPKKSFIICVAGQSNAVGYDESPVSSYISKNLNPNRLRQLGLYDDTNLQNIELGHHAHSFQDMRNVTNPANPSLRGTKGIHLPLGNLLLKEVPEDYEIIFASATYGGTAFTTGTVGTYDEATMKPSANARRWGVDTPFYKSMRDRIKYLLDLNENNVFGGVVWIQGEFDKDNAAGHSTEFEAMTQAFFDYFNQNGYGNRVAKRTWDRDLWYNVETVAYWYTQGQCQQIWDNYKEWNPNTYVEIPRDTDSNAVNGTGGTSSNRPTHYGNDAFQKVIAPRIVKKMIENKGLFNNDIQNQDGNDIGFDTMLDANEYSLVEDAVTGYGDKSAFQLADGILSFNQTPAQLKSHIKFNNAYKINFEVTRALYWFAYRGNFNSIISVIGLGKNSTHTISDINLEAGTLKIHYQNPRPQFAYTLQKGDRISIYKNNDGTFSFYLKKFNEDKYNLWFNFNPKEYPLITSPEEDLFGFSFAYSGNELMAGYTNEILKKCIIQKNQGYINNPTLDKHIYNTAVDVFNKLSSTLQIGNAQPYTIGELKTLAYDLGERTNIGGQTWLRCDGQTVPRQEINMITNEAVTTEDIILPESRDGQYLYVCIGDLG